MEDVRALAREALGRDVTAVERLYGGSKKGVLRLRLDGDGSVVAYVWTTAEDRWTDVREPEEEPFADASGPELFAAAHARLRAAGVRTVEVYAQRGDVALVEDLPGGSLADLLDRDAGDGALRELAAMLRAMRRERSPRYGKVGVPAAGAQEPFPAVVLARALRHLDRAAPREPRLAAARAAVTGALHDRAAAVGERDTYCLVHGELGPDHVRVDGDGHPALIDIEGLMHADPEWEHAFLEIRFGDRYAALRDDDLDPARLELYRLALPLSLVEGPLRFLDTDPPDPGFWRGIAEGNLERVLTAVARATG